MNPLATKLARMIFEIGDEPARLGGKVQRIQFMGGDYPDGEIPLGGLCESSLEHFLDHALHMAKSTPVPVFDYFQGDSDRHWYYVEQGTSALEAKGPFMTKACAIQHSKDGTFRVID